MTAASAVYAADKNEEVMREAARPGNVTLDTLEPASPALHARLPRVVKVSGTADIPRDSGKADVWVVVKVGISAAYYPQGWAPVDESGRWSCLISLGSNSPSDDGVYSIIVYLADPQGTELMKRFMREELPTSVTGMRDFPVGHVHQYDSLGVYRDSAAPAVLTKPRLGCA